MSPAARSNVIDFIQPDKAKEVGGELEATTRSLSTRLAHCAVTDTASLEQAVIDRRAIGDAAKRVEEFFAPFISMAHKLHKALCDRKNEVLAPLLKLDAAKRSAISAYKSEQDRIRLARERDESDRRRRDDEARAAAIAADLEASGHHALASQVIEESIAAPPPVVSVADATKAVDGLKFRRMWKWRYLHNDKDRASQLIPREYMCVDEPRINKVVGALKDTTRIPGIEVFYEDVPVR